MSIPNPLSSQAEIAWAAGVFEGEGSVSWNERNHQARFSMAMTDRDVMERFISIIGSRATLTMSKLRDPKYKTIFQWACLYDEFEPLCELFRPWLCNRRLNKMTEVLEKRLALFEPRTCKHCREKFAPSRARGNRGKKYCSVECRNEGKKLRIKERKKTCRAPIETVTPDIAVQRP